MIFALYPSSFLFQKSRQRLKEYEDSGKISVWWPYQNRILFYSGKEKLPLSDLGVQEERSLNEILDGVSLKQTLEIQLSLKEAFLQSRTAAAMRRLGCG